MEKKRVYQILDGELLYQEDKWTDANIEHGIPDDEKPVSEWVNFMEYHMNKAKEAIYHLDTTEALAQVRKVTALGVRTMMTNGCPVREGYTESEVSYEKNTSESEHQAELDELTENEDIENYIYALSKKFEQLQEKQDITTYIDEVAERLRNIGKSTSCDCDDCKCEKE